jgi:RNA ligase (TIGR02306 family)
MERKLVTLRTINAIKPIPDADAIEIAIVDGWQVVVKKGDFQVGDKAFYFEIDSFLPTDRPEFAFLKAKEGGKKTVYNGVEGHRLRTIRLRKQLSQGLLIARKDTTVKVSDKVLHDLSVISGFDLNQELSDLLTIEFGVQKWDKPLPAELAGTVKSTFPTHIIPKTDQERAQNIIHDLEHHHELFEITVKLDGSSMTAYKYNDEIGVCSRNMDLIEDYNNTFWRVARDGGLIDLLKSLPGNYALQGELMGEGVQGNPEKLTGQRFFLYDIYNIDEKRYLNANERHDLYKINNPIAHQHVPVLAIGALTDYAALCPEQSLIEVLLDMASGPSYNTDVNREGIVFKSINNPEFSFKVISNEYLLKEKE